MKDFRRGKNSLGPQVLRRAALEYGVHPSSLMSLPILKALHGGDYNPAWLLAWTYAALENRTEIRGLDPWMAIISYESAAVAGQLESSILSRLEEAGGPDFLSFPTHDEFDDLAAYRGWAMRFWGHLKLKHGRPILEARFELARRWCREARPNLPPPRAPFLITPAEFQARMRWTEMIRLLEG